MTQFDQRYQQVETQYNADHITIQQQSLSLTEKQRKQNHARMLQRVRAIWIDGVLEPSLQGAAQIALELQKKPSAIVTPLWHVLREFDTTGQLTSENASIVQVYDHASGEVLILGEPGSGKTTLLLELTRTLLERAGQDEAHPIPVVFPLSTWATKRQPLTTWLASELHSRYQVPLPLATSWIETDQVLPLLDGLDEVAATHRAACVEAINSYRQGHGLIPTVVCSRQTDYFALSTRLLLQTAVVVQPLTPEQIETYLTRGGERLDALRETLHEDADLRTLASTPLMLNVLTIAYQGTTSQEITTPGSLDIKQEQVFTSYVQRMLTRRGTSTRYTPKQTIHWLAWLARQLARHNQTQFYIEQLQPTWLKDRRSRFINHCIVVLSYGLFGILFYTLFVEILYLLSSLTTQQSISGNDLLTVPLSMSVPGGVIGLLTGLVSRRTAEIRPIESIVWSLNRIKLSLVIGSMIALVIWLGLWFVGGLGFHLFYGPSFGGGISSSLPMGTLVIGLSIGLIATLVIFLLGGLSGTKMDAQSHVRPNEGIWRSARNGVLWGLLVMPVSLFLLLLFRESGSGGPVGNVGTQIIGAFGFVITVSIALGAILIAWIIPLKMGGGACIQHAILRLFLCHARSIPWNYPHFLDDAAERILLRKVGGGYIFLHRLLLDYFANLENGTSSASESRQESPPSDTKHSKSAEPTGGDEHSVVPTAPLASPLMLSEGSRLVPCGHEQRTPNARFCSICGAPIPSSSLE